MRLRTAARLGALGVLAVAVAGCWPQPGADGGNTKANPGERALTTANVASLEEAWTGRGNVSAVVGGRAIGAVSGAPVEVVAHDVATGEELWVTPLTDSPNAGTVTHDPIVAARKVWVGAVAPASGGCELVAAFLDPATGEVTYEEAGPAPVELRAAGKVVARQPASSRPTAEGGCATQVTQPFEVADDASGSTLWRASGPADAVVGLPGDRWLASYDGTALSGWAAAGCGAGSCAPAWTQERAGDVVDMAAAGGARLAVLQDAAPDAPFAASLSIVDGVTGADIVAGTPVPDGARSVAVGSSSYVLGESEVSASSLTDCGPASCSLLWSATLGGPASTSADLALAGGVLYVPRHDGVVEAYDVAACGTAGGECEPVVEVAVDGPVTALAVAQGRLFVADDDSLTAFAPAAA